MLRNTRFELHTVAASCLIGLKTVWRGSTRVQVSDPARTVIDMLIDPSLAGGVRHLIEMLGALLNDYPNEAANLGVYATKLGVGSVFKRLGYLLQYDHPSQRALIELCQKNLSAGYAKLDPALPADRLITAWRLWVPVAELREVQR
jgi:predicted transcriptional regulator of viral defense system